MNESAHFGGYVKLSEKEPTVKIINRCPHSNLEGIYGDCVNAVGGWRLRCHDCRRYLDGPVALAKFRQGEREAYL